MLRGSGFLLGFRQQVSDGAESWCGAPRAWCCVDVGLSIRVSGWRFGMGEGLDLSVGTGFGGRRRNVGSCVRELLWEVAGFSENLNFRCL